MGHIITKLTLLVSILVVSSLILSKPTYAQVGVTTPATPDFGVRYDIFSTYIPPVYGVDPSTGKAVITQAGYNSLDETVYIEIVNQPFIPYKDSDGHDIQLFYNIRWKDPSNNSWIYLNEVKGNLKWTQTQNSERTISTFSFRENRNKGLLVLDMPIGSETDFQVEASIGYFTADNVFVGKTSGWTDPQAIMHAPDYSSSNPTSMPSSSATPTETHTATPQQNSTQERVLFGLNWQETAIILLGVTVVVLAFALVLSRKRTVKPFT